MLPKKYGQTHSNPCLPPDVAGRGAGGAKTAYLSLPIHYEGNQNSYGSCVLVNPRLSLTEPFLVKRTQP
jgi:hypothetical protein